MLSPTLCVYSCKKETVFLKYMALNLLGFLVFWIIFFSDWPTWSSLSTWSSCLTILISFYDQMTHLLDEGKAVDVVYLDFRKAFDAVPHSILLEKVAAHGLDGGTLDWVKN